MALEKCSSTKRSQKMHWLDDHKNHVHQLTYTHFDTIVVGDSIAAGLSRYSNVWETFFKESLNLGIVGDRTQHILWRVEHLPVPSHLKYVVIHCGTNSISKDSPSEIANSNTVQKKKPLSQNNYYRDFSEGWQVFSLSYNCATNQPAFENFYFHLWFYWLSRTNKGLVKYNGDLHNKLFWTDHLRLSEFASSIFTLLQQHKIVSTYPKLVPVSSVVCKSFILSQRVCEVDPPCYVTVDVSTVKNEKYSLSYYNITSVTNAKVCNFFISCQSVCEVISIHVDVVYVTTYFIVKHWNEISLCRPGILPAPVTHVENVSTYVNKSRKVDCPRITSFDASSTADLDSIDTFKTYDEIEGSTLFLLPMLKKNVEVFVSFLFIILAFNLRIIFIFCPILTFRFNLFIVNNILTIYRYCYYFIYTDIVTISYTLILHTWFIIIF